MMTDRSVTHSTFTLERTYAAPPATVFAAWSDPATKAKWFAAEEWALHAGLSGRRHGGHTGPSFEPAHFSDMACRQAYDSDAPLSTQRRDLRVGRRSMDDREHWARQHGWFLTTQQVGEQIFWQWRRMVEAEDDRHPIFATCDGALVWMAELRRQGALRDTA